MEDFFELSNVQLELGRRKGTMLEITPEEVILTKKMSSGGLGGPVIL